MDIMELGAIGELVGGIAVIASLIYVGLQVGQNNNLARGAAEMEVGRMTMDYARIGAEGDIASIYSLAMFNPESLTEDQRQRAIWHLGMWLHMAQAMFRQFRRGLLPESAWQPIENTIVEASSGMSIFREVWDQNSWGIAIDFRDYIEVLRDQRVKGLLDLSRDESMARFEIFRPRSSSDERG